MIGFLKDLASLVASVVGIRKGPEVKPLHAKNPPPPIPLKKRPKKG